MTDGKTGKTGKTGKPRDKIKIWGIFDNCTTFQKDKYQIIHKIM